MGRPEDIEANPVTGKLYMGMINNNLRKLALTRRLTQSESTLNNR